MELTHGASGTGLGEVDMPLKLIVGNRLIASPLYSHSSDDAVKVGIWVFVVLILSIPYSAENLKMRPEFD